MRVAFTFGKEFFASGFILAFVVLITYQPALGLNFYGDDYSFIEIAGRSTLGQYLAFYFDPRMQTGWYRPMQGMLFGIEWLLFGGNPLGYHAVNIGMHLCNALILFAIVWRVTHSLRVAFPSALVWLGLPLYGVAVFWPGDADFLLTFFYLLAVLFWILYLQEKQNRWKVFSFTAFLFAIATKEFGVTIPVTLFLLDYFVLREKITLRVLFGRYAPFLLVYAIYLPLELYIQSRSVLTNDFGYGIGVHIPQNFLNYLAAVASPWVLPEPLNFIWLALAAICLLAIALTRKTLTPLVLVFLSIIAFAPVTPFPWFFYRYLYSAVVVSAILLALVVNSFVGKFQTRWVAHAASVVLAAFVFGNGLGVAPAISDFAEIGRQTRVPFRDFSQRHSTLPSDTLIYFIDPPTITSQLSGMFFLRYGNGVRVVSDDQAVRANLRDHQAAYIIYFDEHKRTREISVEKNISAQSDSPLPPKLKGWELAANHVKRGESVALILYWEAATEATVALVDNTIGQAISSSRGLPRGNVADARVLEIPPESSPGNYRVDVFEAGKKISIAPIVVSE